MNDISGLMPCVLINQKSWKGTTRLNLWGAFIASQKNTIAWLGLSMDDSDLAIDKVVEFEGLVERKGYDRISVSVKSKPSYSSRRTEAFT